MADDKTKTKNSKPPWEEKANGPRKGRLRRFILWVLALGAVGAVGYGLRPKPIEVELGVVSRGPLTVNVTEEGKTRIRNRYIVSCPVAGQMRRVTLKAGDEVKANETVITVIEPTLAPLLDARSKAQAEARVSAADAGRLKAKEALDMAKTALQFATTNWNRVKNLREKGTVSDTDRDNAERDAEMKTREMQAAEFSLKVAEYELTQAKAALLQIESPAGSGTAIDIRAPVSGRVLKVLQESAMVVTPGTAILEIGDPSDIEIEAEILSRDAVGIKPGTPVVIEQWGGDAPLAAVVRRIEPAAFTKVSALGVEEQRVIVLCDLTHPPEAAKALGDRYRVEVRIAVWHSDDVLLVPAGALFREGSEWKTFRFDQDAARTVTIQSGKTDGRMTQVLGGIEAGAQVLLHPPDTVKDGVAVKKREG
ncbi:MAG: HlyD family efflux transporter periplasmic adaptor subunit [Verrucomicrobiaceae bacterium]|nr:HlyD family efflux transporter periplasmic adaptor subunit [Verrucomicrobiaceae bacterium]